jgi:hypothetical protein
MRITLFLTVLGAAVLAACGSHDGGTVSGPPSQSPVGSLTITPDTPAVLRGAAVVLTAGVKDINGQPLSGYTVNWSSSSPAVATVDASGLVHALAAGETMLQASAGGKSAQTVVTVTLPTIDSAAVVNDSVVLTVGRGSSVVIPRGALPAGSVVVAREEPVGADSVAGTPVGPRIELQVRTAGAAVRSHPAGSADAAAPDSMVLHLRAKLPQPLANVRDQLSVVISDPADLSSGIVTQSFDAVERVGEFGERVMDLTLSLPANLGHVSISAGLTQKHCGEDSWGLYRVSEGSANRIPVILIHGWKPEKLGCQRQKDWRPENDVWSAL